MCYLCGKCEYQLIEALYKKRFVQTRIIFSFFSLSFPDFARQWAVMKENFAEMLVRVIY
jgi:hypothetical protein